MYKSELKRAWIRLVSTMDPKPIVSTQSVRYVAASSQRRVGAPTRVHTTTTKDANDDEDRLNAWLDDCLRINEEHWDDVADRMNDSSSLSSSSSSSSSSRSAASSLSSSDASASVPERPTIQFPQAMRTSSSSATTTRRLNQQQQQQQPRIWNE